MLSGLSTIPPWQKAGIHIRYNEHIIRRPDLTRPMKPHYLFDTNVVVLTLFPGIQESIINSVLHVPGLKAVVLKTFGSGNAPPKRMVRPAVKGRDRAWHHHCQHHSMPKWRRRDGPLRNRAASSSSRSHQRL